MSPEMFEVRHDVVIPVSVRRVWNTLIDFDGYHGWTAAVRFEGTLSPGEELKCTVAWRTERGAIKSYRLEGDIREVLPVQRLVWTVGSPLILFMIFTLEINQRPNGAKLSQRVLARGFLPKFIQRKFERIFRMTFVQLSSDLKAKFS